MRIIERSVNMSLIQHAITLGILASLIALYVIDEYFTLSKAPSTSKKTPNPNCPFCMASSIFLVSLCMAASVLLLFLNPNWFFVSLLSMDTSLSR